MLTRREGLLLAIAALAVSFNLFAQSWAITFDPDGRAWLPGSISVMGTLNHFGCQNGGTNDCVKLSAQGEGNGGVVLGLSNNLQDYRPLNFRGETVSADYRIGTPPSGMHARGWTLNAEGNFQVSNKLQPLGPVDLSVGPYAYVRMHPTYGMTLNDPSDSYNRFYFSPDGTTVRWWRFGAAANYTPGMRALVVDSDGRIYTGPPVP